MVIEEESIIIIRGRCPVSHQMERFLFNNHYPTSMRIAIVHTYIEKRIEGYITLIKLANLLSEQNEVNVVLYEIPKSIERKVREMIGKAHLQFIKYGEIKPGFIHGMKFEVSGLPDFRLFNYLRRTEYDAILVISSGQAWWLAFFYHILDPRKRTIVGLVPTDPPRQVKLEFYVDHKRPHIWEFRSWFFMQMQYFRLKFFDIVFGQSKLTDEIFSYFYNINTIGLAGTFDDTIYNVQHIENLAKPYIAVPTVSLDDDRIALIKQLKSDGVNMRIFGKIRIGIAEELGYVSTETLIDIFRGAAATLFLFDYESLGLIPFESLAVGTPVITERKLGPYSDLKDNAYTNFIDISEYNSILNLCENYLNRDRSIEENEQISRSVSDRTFENYVKIIYENISILSNDKLKN